MVPSPLQPNVRSKQKDFVMYSGPLLEIAAAKSIPELFKVTKSVVQKVMRSQSVEFLMMEKEIIHGISIEKDMRMSKIRHAQYTF